MNPRKKKRINRLLADGQAAWQADDRTLAHSRWGEALNQDPGNAQASFLYGTLLFGERHFGAALPILAQAADLQPEAHEPLNNMGNCFRGIGMDERAEEIWLKAAELMEAHGRIDADVYNNLASACINAARPEEGEAWARKCLKAKPDHPQGGWNLCLCLLEQGRLLEGWTEHKVGFRSGVRPNKQFDAPPWDGSHVHRLVVYGEQGQGDELLFAEAINEARSHCDNLILDCHPRLQGLFSRSFDLEACYGTRKFKESKWIYDHGKIDAKISIGDLQLLFRTRWEDFPRHRDGGFKPYLKTNPATDTALARRVAHAAEGKFRVGIAWEGGIVSTHSHYRTPDMDHFKALVEAFPEVEFFSVHYRGDAAEQLADAGIKGVHHWQEVVDNFDALTSLAAQMDLVITVDQTMVHQCGSIGQACWIPLPHRCSWRYMKEVDGNPMADHMLWYGDNVRLFRQDPDCAWEPVFERIHKALTETISNGADRDRKNSPHQPGRLHIPGLSGDADRVPRAAE